MTDDRHRYPILRRYVALPNDHGSWVFLLSPMLIGFFTAGQWRPEAGYLISGALAAFLLRQPASIAAKAYSGRRSRRELPAAWFWLGVYGSLALGSLAMLIGQGYGTLLWLAVPGLLVFAWHLLLVGKRNERHQMGTDILASGALALAAPAADWVSVGSTDPIGWALWALAWLQSASSIVYAFLRLEQRALAAIPDLRTRFKMARRALLYTSFNLAATTALALAGLLPRLLPLAYALQWAESIWGALYPAIGFKPTRIGIRQLLLSTLFTGVFIWVWRL